MSVFKIMLAVILVAVAALDVLLVLCSIRVGSDYDDAVMPEGGADE